MDYISDNWGLIILLAGLVIVLVTDIHLERKMVKRILLISVMVLIYSITCYVEMYFSDLDHITMARAVFSAINYSLLTFIIVNVILILFPNNKLWLYIPAVVHSVICFVSIPTGIVFSFHAPNNFERGPLGLLPYAVNALYLIYLFLCLFLRRKRQREDTVLLVFVLITCVTCLVLPLFLKGGNSGWFYMTIMIDITLYYIFLLQQYTKRDPLTGLLNRQSYYTDSEKYGSLVTAVITMDMNGLKHINDNEGHLAGDRALKTLGECFWRACEMRHRVYRIGGDEFVILCINTSEDQVKDLIAKIRKETEKTEYTCSIGYSMRSEGSDLEKMYTFADRMLYEEKHEYYTLTGNDRRTV